MNIFFPLGLSSDLQSTYSSCKSEDDLVELLGLHPENLLNIFKQACSIENGWQTSKPELFEKLLGKIIYLISENKFNKEQVNKIDQFFQNIHPSQSPQFNEKIANLFTQTTNLLNIDEKNVFEYLSIASEHQLNSLKDKCLKFIQENTGTKIVSKDFKDYSIEIESMKGELSNLNNYLTSLINANYHLTINFKPSKSIKPDELISFSQQYGSSINTLNLQEYGSQLNDSLLIKLIDNCRHLHNIFIGSNIITSRALQGLDKLSSLKALNLRWCSSLKELPTLDKLFSLQTLDLGRCSSLKELPSLEKLSSLQRLDLGGCSSLEKLPSLDKLSSLLTLDLSTCSSLKELPSLDKLSSLLTLDLSTCSSLKELPSLDKLSSLQTLDLCLCSSLKELPSLEKLSSLQRLDLRRCSSLEKLPFLEMLSSLQTLDLSMCSSLKELPSLEKLSSLQTLNLRRCSSLKELLSLKKLSSLQTLNLSGCASLKELPSLEKLSSLQTLDLSGCASLKELPSLEMLSSLQTLNLSMCSSLEKLPSLEMLSSLQTLNLSMCSSLEKLPFLEMLSSLQTLNLSMCSSLEKLPSLEMLSSLQMLDLSMCSSLKELPALEKLSSLQTLNLRECSSLDDKSRLTAFISLLKGNIDLGLKLYSSFELTKNIGDFVVENFSAEEIIKNLSMILDHVKFKDRALIAIAIAKQDMDTFFEKIDQFPIKNISENMIEANPRLKRLFTYSLNDQEVLQKAFQEKVIEFPDIPEIKIEELLDLFDAISFNNPAKLGYKNPAKLTKEGEKVSKEDLRIGIVTLLSYIENKQAYTAVPSDEMERAEWYQKLTAILKNDIQKMKKEEDKTLVSTEMIRLAASTPPLCGSRWRGEGIDIYKTLSGIWDQVIENSSLEGLFRGWFDLYKEGILQQQILDFTPIVGRGMQPHIYNYAAKTVQEHKVVLPSSILVDLNDKHMPKKSITEEEIMDSFMNYFAPIVLAKYLHGKSLEEIQRKPECLNLFHDLLREYAEKKMAVSEAYQENIQEIGTLEKNLEETKLTYGKNQTEQNLKQAKLRLVVLQNNPNEVAEIVKDPKMKIPFMMAKQQILQEKSAIQELKKSIETYELMLNNPASYREDFKKLGMENKEKAGELAEEDLIKKGMDVMRQNLEKANQDIAKLEHSVDIELDKIKNYEQMLSDVAGHIDDFKELGKERATSEFRSRKDELMDEYLEKEGLVEKKMLTVNVDKEMKEAELAVPTLYGILNLLEHLGFIR